MADVRAVRPGLAVAGQIQPSDVQAAAEAGFALIINNRPDGESPDQPAGAAIEAACRETGMAYIAMPIAGMPPSTDQGARMKAAVDGAAGPVLAFCRSGTRSISAWAIGEALAGADRGALIEDARKAGYDISPLLS